MNLEEVTQRIVLKVMSSIFDPMGILSPSVMVLKLLFQEVCSMKCGWDIPLSEGFVSRWNGVLRMLNNLVTISIPGHYLEINSTENIRRVHLHGFRDVSLKGGAAVVYVRLFY